jgi:signal transduction histidine kinase/CheY-like chemotaxis protein
MYSFRHAPDGRVTFPFATERTRDIFGLEPDALAEDAELALSRIHQDDIQRVRASIARSAQTLRLWSEVFRYHHPQKGTIWVEGRSTPLLEPDGSVLWHGFLLDVTDRRLLEDQYRQAQKMEAIGRLAGGVAHDFNNLLTVILGHASTMPLTTDDPETLEQAREIALAAERAAGLTRQLLLFSRKQVMRPVGVNLNETIGAVTRMLQRIIGEDIVLHADFAPGLPLVHADPGMLEQVLLNLAVNSRDAMPAGGNLTLSTRNGVAAAHEAQCATEGLSGPFVCLSVRDTGTGIPPEVLPRIYEPFFTTKEAGKGTGLGLATVYGIVRQHGGWLTVDSEVGRGTTFHLYFPAMPTRNEVAVAPEPLPGLERGTETILVVEDEPAVQRLTAAVLTRCGYTVHTASSGVAALAEWKARGASIDLVLTDMVMPEGMTGPALAARLREDRPHLKVVFTSGYSADIVGGEITRDPRVYFLQKPFQPDRLAHIVRQCLDGRPPD